jgi:hypothetical protein
MQPISADPVTENMAAMKGAPLVPRQDQNHDAHIVAHAAMINNVAYKENYYNASSFSFTYTRSFSYEV